MLMTKPIALWVINVLCIVAVSGNHDYSDSRVGERKIAALFLQCNRNYETTNVSGLSILTVAYLKILVSFKVHHF